MYNENKSRRRNWAALREGKQPNGAWSRLDENLKGQHWKKTRLDLHWSDLYREGPIGYWLVPSRDWTTPRDKAVRSTQGPGKRRRTLQLASQGKTT